MKHPRRSQLNAEAALIIIILWMIGCLYMFIKLIQAGI